MERKRGKSEPCVNRVDCLTYGTLFGFQDLLLEELRNLLAQYYGNPSAKDETASLESPVKKRKLEHTGEPASKQEETFHTLGRAIGGMTVEPLQPKPPQSQEPRTETEAPAKKTSDHDKENVVAVNRLAEPSSKPCIVNILDENITPEKWSMGQVKEISGHFFQVSCFKRRAALYVIRQTLQI